MKTHFSIPSILLVLMFSFMSFGSASSSLEETKRANKTIISSVTFKIKNAGITVDGSFKGFQGIVNFDPNNLSASKLEASVETKTINTDNNARDNHLREDEYFDVEKYPKISMKSKSISKVSDGKYKATFDLTIKGKSKEVSFPFTYQTTDKGYKLSGSFEIDRRDFGVGGSSWILSDDVKVFLNVTVQE